VFGEPTNDAVDGLVGGARESRSPEGKVVGTELALCGGEARAFTAAAVRQENKESGNTNHGTRLVIGEESAAFAASSFLPRCTKVRRTHSARACTPALGRGTAFSLENSQG
jgi:hypothetical protein